MQVCILIRVVPATKSDIPKIFEIEQEAFSPPWTEESLLDELQRDDSCFVVAVDDTGEPSPCVLGFAIFRQVGDDGELLQIAVDKSARQSGVGDLLMATVLDYAAKESFSSVFLEVRSSNTAAVNLYKKHGFTTVRIRKNYYDSPVEDALIMTRVINL